ncbi:MAG: signal peptidase I [Tannerellaceae bacterium]|jgi:signal peptidase I|nr:signal peptidase I [Tannerellaceae bacterium]
MDAEKKRKIISVGVNILFVSCLLLVGWIIFQLFFFASFRIPSNSMEPALKNGDHVLVWKGIPGARLFNIFDLLDRKSTTIYRLPRVRDVKRNDVLVFNAPYPRSSDKLEMHLMKYYVKRCFGLPGDTVAIQNDTYLINGHAYDIKYKEFLPEINNSFITEFSEAAKPAFPSDSITQWDIRNFGPLYIPRKGDTLSMNRENYSLYHKLIEWEQQAEVFYRDSVVYLNHHPLPSYTFQQNYFFMLSDYGKYSYDSRYWGLLPEDFIVGKVWIIRKSTDPYWGEWRWDRFLKKVD